MALVAAKCPNCGGNLEVDASKEAGICPFCNTAYITQKAIVNYNTNIINNNYINAEKIELSVPETKKRKIHIYCLKYPDYYRDGASMLQITKKRDCLLFLDDNIIDTINETHTLTIEVDANVQHMIREKRVLDIQENERVFDGGAKWHLESRGTRTVDKYSSTIIISAGEGDIWIVEDGKIINTEKEFLEYKEKKKKEDQERSKAQIEQYKRERAFKEKLKKKWTVIFAISIIALIVGVILIIVGRVQMSNNSGIWGSASAYNQGLYTLVAGVVITIVFAILSIFSGTIRKTD